MGAKSKSGKVSRAARKSVSKVAGRRGRREVAPHDVWATPVPEERDDEIDCQRIVEGYGGRSLPPYFDDYN